MTEIDRLSRRMERGDERARAELGRIAMSGDDRAMSAFVAFSERKRDGRWRDVMSLERRQGDIDRRMSLVLRDVHASISGRRVFAPILEMYECDWGQAWKGNSYRILRAHPVGVGRSGRTMILPEAEPHGGIIVEPRGAFERQWAHSWVAEGSWLQTRLPVIVPGRPDLESGRDELGYSVPRAFLAGPTWGIDDGVHCDPYDKGWNWHIVEGPSANPGAFDREEKRLRRAEREARELEAAIRSGRRPPWADPRYARLAARALNEAHGTSSRVHASFGYVGDPDAIYVHANNEVAFPWRGDDRVVAFAQVIVVRHGVVTESMIAFSSDDGHDPSVVCQDGTPSGRRGGAPSMEEQRYAQGRAKAFRRWVDEHHPGKPYWSGKAKKDDHGKIVGFDEFHDELLFPISPDGAP